MFFNRLFSRGDYEAQGEAARRYHSSWLTNAMRVGKRLPRIPVEPVSGGGFATLTATPAGREWCEQWWEQTLESPELEG